MQTMAKDPPPVGLRPDPWLVALVLLVHAGLWWWAQPIVEGSDDLSYATFAHRMQTGTFLFEAHHFAHRLGILSPTALLYALFGVNPYTTTGWSLICSLLTIWGVHRVALPLAGRLAALLAALVLATNTFWLEQALGLGPDLPVAACAFAALAVLAQARAPGGCRLSPREAGLLVSLALTAAVLTKLSIIWVIYFLALVMLHDLYHGRHRALWGWIAVSGGVMGALYLGVYQLLRGDPLYHLHVVNQIYNNPYGIWTYSAESGNSLMARLTYQPIRMILEIPGFVTLVFLSIPLAWLFLKGVEPERRGEYRYWLGMMGLVLFVFWFATNSFQYYNPMMLCGRYLMFLFPPAALLGGAILAGLIQRPQRGALVVPMAGVGAGMVVVLQGFGFWKREILLLELCLLVLAAERWWPAVARRHQRWLATGLVAATLVILPVLAVGQGVLGPTVWQKIYRGLMRESLAPLQEPVVLYTDARVITTLEWMAGFRSPDFVQMVNWRTPGLRVVLPAGGARRWILLNARDEQADRLQALLKDPPREWKLLWKSRHTPKEAAYLFETSEADPIPTLFSRFPEQMTPNVVKPKSVP
ncbi:MAG: hypothetical protein HQL98_06365 [Magnetococcales bacterium]|nr:hypothetical protein [Magnetococcales bacterium]